MAADKVIVTNESALRAKYGDKFTRVKSAIQALIDADAGRDLVTKLVAIDSQTDMARVGAKPVTSPDDQEGAKAAVDAIYTHDRPDYILLLGAHDVVPHIHLTNPMREEDDEEDPDVPSDVPYACAAAFSRRPQDFLGPTRVVGRLPDLTGADEPSYLVKVLGTAARFVCRDPQDYSTHFRADREGLAAIDQEIGAQAVRSRCGGVQRAAARSAMDDQTAGAAHSFHQLSRRHRVAELLRRVPERHLLHGSQRSTSADQGHQGVGGRCRVLLWRGALRAEPRAWTDGYLQRLSRRGRVRLLREHNHRVRSFNRPRASRPHVSVLRSRRP